MPKSTFRGTLKPSLISSLVFEADGRASTSSRLKCLVLCITAEARRFWRYKQLYFYFRFRFCGVLQVLVTGKVTFDVEKVARFAIAQFRVVARTGAVPAIKSEATTIFAPQDGRWKITVSFDGRRFCVPKFRH